MNIKNYKKYQYFDYKTEVKRHKYKLGDIVIKPFYYDNGQDDLTCNEIGVVLQLFDHGELRTDMFGNECNSMLRLATMDEIKQFRPELLTDLNNQ